MSGLTDGARYYLAVKAYNGTTTSNFSSEVNAVVLAAAPVASFNASPTTGTAPLVVTLTDTSSGSITSRSWNLGDGTTATTQAVADLFEPRDLRVTLTVTGSGGSTTATRSISVTAPTVTSGSGGTTTGDTTGSTTGGATTTSGTAANTKGLVAAYGFEEPTGRDVVNASQPGNAGMISGAARVATAFFGRALRFNGKSDGATVDDSASLDLTNGMTLEAWVYPTVPMSSRTTVLLKERSRGLAYSLYANSDRGNPSNTINTGDANSESQPAPSCQSTPGPTWLRPMTARRSGST